MRLRKWSLRLLTREWSRSAMQEEAQRGLDWRAEFGRGGTAIGVARARDIVNGRALSLETVKRMRSYFARHEVDKAGQGWSPDEDGYPSAGRIAWALWGGDPARTWADGIVAALDERQTMEDGYDDGEDDEMPESVFAVPMESEEGLSTVQTFLYSALEAITEYGGKFDQSTGANGAHYVAESPFAEENLVCANCVFYEGGRGCEIVSGDIAPEGICKFWIISEAVLSGEPQPEEEPATEPMAEDEPTEEASSVGARDGRIASVRELSSPRKDYAMPETIQWVAKQVSEKRSLAFTNLEMRANGDGTTLVGYAAVWDSPSEPLPWIEYVRRGAFAKTLKDGADVRLLIDHEGVPLARTKSGTLRLMEDDRGLRTETDLDPMNPDAARIISAMRRGDLSQMSFAFRTVKDSWNADRTVRELREVRLYDVSVVTFPAYEETVAELRASLRGDTVSTPDSQVLLRKNQLRLARYR
jgi:HK97 family phage prohead protease